MKRILAGIQDRFFESIHGNRLIYNACWEDPEIDRRLLDIDPESRILTITSAGCNVLDYLLDLPAEIHAVDVNPRQNALLELKLALIREGDFDVFYAMFGKGKCTEYQNVYARLRISLPRYASDFWDDHIDYFHPEKGLRRSFYFHGTSGLVAWFFQFYMQHFKKKARMDINALLKAKSLHEQNYLYKRIEHLIWDRFNTWLVSQPAFMTMVGVPRSQIRLIEETHPGGLSGYTRDKLRYVFTNVPVAENYFWRVYLTGTYAPECCPNYLKAENFERLRSLIDRIHVYNLSITEFLNRHPGTYTHYILLDHQDWMAGNAREALKEEWEYILGNSRPGTKILFRSACVDHGFLPQVALGALRFMTERTTPLHGQDRVGTYGSLHFAEVA